MGCLILHDLCMQQLLGSVCSIACAGAGAMTPHWAIFTAVVQLQTRPWPHCSRSLATPGHHWGQLGPCVPPADAPISTSAPPPLDPGIFLKLK